MANDRGAWLDWVTNGRIDIAMAAVLLAFFYYKGGLRLVSFLVITFLFLVALYHLATWLIRRYSQFRDRGKQREIAAASEQEPGEPY